ncbi:MAG: hypothetical protein HC836_41260 [Richelia sp. RM2_1_2]|nr:hypothetical protein [Richelia sp. RM2_1_2]
MSTDISSIQSAIAKRFARLGDASNFDVQLTLNEIAAKFNEYTPTDDLDTDFSLEELSDVDITGRINNSILQYNATASEYQHRLLPSIPFKGSTGIWMAPLSGTTPELFGFGNLVQGTPSFVASVGTASVTTGHSIQYTTDSVIDDIAGTTHGNLQVSLGQGFEYEARVNWAIDYAAGGKFFIGLIGQTTFPLGTVDIASLTNLFGVGLDATDNAVLQIINNDSTGVASVTNFTGVPAIDITDSYVVNIKSLTSISVRITITSIKTGATLSFDISGNMPLPTQLLSPIIYCVADDTGTASSVAVFRQTLIATY